MFGRTTILLSNGKLCHNVPQTTVTLFILLAGSNGCRGLQSLADYLCGIVKTPPVSYQGLFWNVLKLNFQIKHNFFFEFWLIWDLQSMADLHAGHMEDSTMILD